MPTTYNTVTHSSSNINMFIQLNQSVGYVSHPLTKHFSWAQDCSHGLKTGLIPPPLFLAMVPGKSKGEVDPV